MGIWVIHAEDAQDVRVEKKMGKEGERGLIRINTWYGETEKSKIDGMMEFHVFSFRVERELEMDWREEGARLNSKRVFSGVKAFWGFDGVW